jgi:hypothetical protein
METWTKKGEIDVSRSTFHTPPTAHGLGNKLHEIIQVMAHAEVWEHRMKNLAPHLTQQIKGKTSLTKEQGGKEELAYSLFRTPLSAKSM